MCDDADRLALAIMAAPLPCPVPGCGEPVTIRYFQVNGPFDPEEWDSELEGE